MQRLFCLKIVTFVLLCGCGNQRPVRDAQPTDRDARPALRDLSAIVDGATLDLSDNVKRDARADLAAAKPDAAAQDVGTDASLVCSTGRGDCDGQRSNGCEVQLASSRCHCGRCDHDCSGGRCESGVCILLEQPILTCPLISAGDALYLVTGSPQGLSRLSKQGGTPSKLIDRPIAYAIDGPNLYWLQSQATQFELLRRPLLSGSASLLATLGKSDVPRSLAVHQGIAAWVTGDYLRWDNNGGTVWGYSSGQSKALATTRDGPQRALVDGAAIYWSENDALFGVQASGGSPWLVAKGQDAPLHLAADSTHLYWTFSSPTSAGSMTFCPTCGIARAPKAGGAVQVIATTTYPPQALALQNQVIFWQDGNPPAQPATIRRVAVGGGSLETAASDVRGGCFAVDAQSLYYVRENPTTQQQELVKVPWQ